MFFDGVLLRSDEVRISPFDMGMTVGDGVFETLLVRDGEVFAFSRHFARLQNSAALLGMEVPEKEILREQASVLIQARAVKRGRLRITLITGVPEDGFSRLLENQRVLMTLGKIAAKTTRAKVLLSQARRFSDAISSRAKTLSYGENVWALRAGHARGADEVLLANERGELCEGAMSNVFFLKKGVWHTPPLSSGCLPGITRALVDEILAMGNSKCHHESVEIKDLGEIEEMVLTSSLRGVQPVDCLEGRRLDMSEGKKLALRYEDLVAAQNDP